MTFWQDYLKPKTLAEAINALASAPPPILPIVGGTDFLLDLKQRRHVLVNTLLDVTSIKEMTRLEITGDELFIGASISVNRIATTPEVAHHAQVVFRPIMGSSSVQGQCA